VIRYGDVEYTHPARGNKACDEAGPREHCQPIERGRSGYKIEMRQHCPRATNQAQPFKSKVVGFPGRRSIQLI
jgi:hypothetical protein